MRYALINNETNVVENVIELEDGHKWKCPENYRVEPTDEHTINDQHDGEKFIAVPRVFTPEEQKKRALFALSIHDSFLPRAMEDIWEAMGVDTTKLPEAQQACLKDKIALRTQLAELAKQGGL